MKHFPKLNGLIAAPFTPMHKDGSINLDVIKPYADFLIQQGIKGAFICGTTGEGISMTIEERNKIAESWIAAAEGKLKIIVHVGANCQLDSISLATHAKECGADAIASIAPNFFKPCSVDDLIGFFAPIAAAAPELPFYYYNMPSMSGVYLPSDTILKRGKEVIPNLAGIKFTHNNLMEMCQCISIENGSFDVLHGYDEILICGLSLGAKAAVGSTYNYAGRIYNKLLELFEMGKIEEAVEYQKYSVEIVKIIIKYGGGVRGGKAIMNLLGIDCGECRLPISRFTPEEYSSLKNDLNTINFFNKIQQ